MRLPYEEQWGEEGWGEKGEEVDMTRAQEKGKPAKTERGDRQCEQEKEEAGRGSGRRWDTGTKEQIPRRTKSSVG